MDAVTIGISLLLGTGFVVYAAVQHFLAPSRLRELDDQTGDSGVLDAWAATHGLTYRHAPGPGRGWEGVIDGVVVRVSTNAGFFVRSWKMTLVARSGLPEDAVVCPISAEPDGWKPTGIDALDEVVAVVSEDRAFVERCAAMVPLLASGLRDGATVGGGAYTVARPGDLDPAVLDPWLLRHVEVAGALGAGAA